MKSKRPILPKPDAEKRTAGSLHPDGSARAWHCWNCHGELDAKSIKTLHDGTVVGTCWRCGHDDVSAIENDSEE